MKTKKKLLLITIFVFMIAMFTVASNKVLAAIPEGMSEKFKNILNEDGKLIVKDTTMRDNKYEVLNEYLSKYNGTNYNFYIVNHKEDFSTCKIARSVVNSGTPEEYEVEVKDGYAIFNTKHFSIYTLAETKTNEENNNNDEQGNNNENGSEENGTGKNETNKENENIENSPRTGDNIVVLVGTLFIAVIGTVATIKFRRYNKTK